MTKAFLEQPSLCPGLLTRRVHWKITQQQQNKAKWNSLPNIANLFGKTVKFVCKEQQFSLQLHMNHLENFTESPEVHSTLVRSCFCSLMQFQAVGDSFLLTIY